MSDPVSTMDVEDVLSSIRRLVSEEAKGAGHAGESASGISSAGLHEEAENAASDALSELVQAVEGGADMSLGDTESRYSDDEDDALDSETDYESDPQVSFRHQAASANRRNDDQKLVLTAALRVADPEPLENTSGSFGTAPHVADEDLADDSAANGSGAASEASDAPYSYPHLRPVDDVQDENTQPENTDPQSEKPAPFDYAPEDTLFDRAKQAMEAVKDGRVARGDLASTIARPQPDSVAPLRAVEAANHDGPVSGNVEEVAEAETAEMSEAEAEENTSGETADISPTSPFRAAGGAFARTEAVNADAETDEFDEGEPSTINFAEADDSILDEDTLRDLVSDMVREELQGELGDRITRNVRKLVRREIQRAMASREFE